MDKYYDSRIEGRNRKFHTRDSDDFELSQRMTTQALVDFRHSMVEEMKSLWQSMVMPHLPLLPVS